MLEKIDIAEKTIHIWQADLSASIHAVNKLQTYLSQDETDRADRFHFNIHRRRYIAARGYLRLILAKYLNTNPNDIVFSYSEHEKPSVSSPRTTLQFNLSHSEDKVIYAFILDHEIGIDIEKVQSEYNPGVANRFFSQRENVELQALNEVERCHAFYRIWARKEAVIKAIGRGLSIPLSSFSVSLSKTTETLNLISYPPLSLISLPLYSDYEMAVCTFEKANKLIIFNINDQISTLETTYDL